MFEYMCQDSPSPPPPWVMVLRSPLLSSPLWLVTPVVVTRSSPLWPPVRPLWLSLAPPVVIARLFLWFSFGPPVVVTPPERPGPSASPDHDPRQAGGGGCESRILAHIYIYTGWVLGIGTFPKWLGTTRKDPRTPGGSQQELQGAPQGLTKSSLRAPSGCH